MARKNPIPKKMAEAERRIQELRGKEKPEDPWQAREKP